MAGMFIDALAYCELGSAFPAPVRDVPCVAFGLYCRAEYRAMTLMASMNVLSCPFPAQADERVYPACKQDSETDNPYCIHG